MTHHIDRLLIALDDEGLAGLDVGTPSTPGRGNSPNTPEPDTTHSVLMVTGSDLLTIC